MKSAARPSARVVSYVLDASALLAMLLAERGADYVWQRRHGAVLSTVNYTEALTRLARHGKSLDQSEDRLRLLELDLVPFDRQQAAVAASLSLAGKPLGLPLGDRACLALGLVRNIPVLTAERAWKKLDLNVSIELIR
jgi:PIN domain nuclease of toxin-antitoxin system